MTNERKFDIYDRAFKFAVRSAQFIKALEKNIIVIEYSKQLIRSSASIGANLEEADGALSRKDFVNKIGIARREARESHHWVRLIQAVANFTEKSHKEEAGWLLNESKEIMLILSSIINKTKGVN